MKQIEAWGARERAKSSYPLKPAPVKVKASYLNQSVCMMYLTVQKWNKYSTNNVQRLPSQITKTDMKSKESKKK
jgi:hypothetical protein